MLRNRNIDRICAFALAAMIVIASCCTALAINGTIQQRALNTGYEDRLFDQSTVHTVDIVIDNWEDFLKTCSAEKYSLCSVVIDGEKFTSVAIRGKGNTSLSNVERYGNNRYSFKLEFDHYQAGRSYHGLDKLCLNNLIQDATYMKDYLAYTLMNRMGVPAPLCSFVKVNVNGEYWGLYLAVEAVEDAFMERNYGSTAGELYKPDTMSMGGGKGNGEDFRMSEFKEKFENGELPQPPAQGEASEGFGQGGGPQMPGMGGFGSSDVKLQYSDDDPDSYLNIFNNAKTDPDSADKARLIQSIKALNEGTDIESVVNVEEVMRYFVVHSFLVNGDSYTGSMIHNYYLYENGGVLEMIPWDYNLSLGAFSMGSGSGTDSATAAVNDPIDTPVSGGDVTDRPMLAWIFADETYTERYHQLYSEFMADVYDSGWLLQEIDRVRDMIAPYVESDPTAFFTYEAFEKGADTLRSFMELRCQSVEGQLSGAIPATTEGQSQDNSAFIDASALTISDMGEMGFGGGSGNGGGPDFGSVPGDGSVPGGGNLPGDGSVPGGGSETGSMPDFSGGFPGFPGSDTGDGTFPQMPDGTTPGQAEAENSPTEALPMFAASMALLLAGLIFARRSALCR